MADKSSIADGLRVLSAEELTDYGTQLQGQTSLADALRENEAIIDRSPVQDTAVGIFDSLQTISTAALAPLPGVGLADIGRMSGELDQFRSPGYLVERASDAERVARATTENGEWAGFKEGVGSTLEGGNLAPDALAQLPFLAIAPVARGLGFVAANAVPGVLSKAAAAVGGTSKAAVINRIALLSAGLEGAGGYSQTYERAIAEGLSPEEADAQAQKAGLASAIAGGILGKFTPGFEMDPLGIKRGGPAAKFLGDIIAPSLSNIAGEAVEEGGIALTNQVADNVLAGRDPLEGVGGQIGQAVAISTVFSGGMQTPGLIRDTSRAIGRGVKEGLAALSSGIMARATTPESAAATAAAEVVAEANTTEGEVIPSTAAEEVAASEVVREQPEFELDGNAPETLRPGRPTSNSPMVENVLLNAQLELAIEQASDDEQKQAELIASQEEFAADVEEATKAIEQLTPEAVAQRVEQDDEQSQLLVEAVRLTDVTKLPESTLSEDEQAIASTMRELADTGVDRTAQQIFETGFAGKVGSRGVRGFLQSILNYGRLIGDKTNEGSQNLTRFVGVLEERARLFQVALDQVEAARAKGIKRLDVVGSKTLGKDGKLTDRPFIIWTERPNSIAAAQRVVADAARARGALENARKRFPGMFKGVPTAEVAADRDAAPKPAAAIRAQVTPAAVTAPAAPTPTPAPAVVEPAPVVDEGGLSLADDAAPVAEAPDLEANAKKEEGLYPDQFKEPSSTRIEDESGLIDVDTTGDTWRGTNTWNAPGATKGSGFKRLVRVLGMAKLAGKKYNSDDSVHQSALKMYLKAIDRGDITATFDRAAVQEAIDANRPLRREGGVFQNVQLVEQAVVQEDKAAAKREEKNRKAREKRAAAKAAKQAAEKETPNEVPATPAPTVAEVEATAPTPTIAEQAETREEGPPSFSDEDMASLMEAGEQENNDDSWFEAEQASATAEGPETEQATNPLTLAPLAEGQSWVNPDLLSAFKLNPVKSVLAMIRKLQTLAPKDSAYLNQFYDNLRPAMDKVFVEGIAKKKLNDPDRLKEFLSRPYGVFAQALIRNADGSLEVHPAIREALTYAALIQLHRAPEQYSADAMYDDKTGLPIRSAQAHAWARNIARDTALLLGMKPGMEDSEAITQGVLLSLSLSAVQAMINNNDITLQKENVLGKDYNLLTPTEPVLKTWKNHLGLVDNVAKIIGAPRVYTASTTPSTNIPERVNHSSTKLSEPQNTATQNLNNVPHYLNPLMMRMLEIVGQAGFNRLATGTEYRDDMPKAVRDWIRAKVTGIRSEVRAANHYQKMLGEATSDPLFWEYGVDSNGRSSSYMGPQGYTLLRDLFSSAKATINLKNSIHVQKTELAIAQALGVKLDQTPEQIEKEYRQKVLQVGEAAKLLVQGIQDGENIMPVLERGTPIKPRELAGMLTLGELLLAQEAGQTTLTTFLPIEVDGKTNGAVNAELLYGLGGTISEANLEQGGVFLDTGETSWGERISYIIEKFQHKDLYLRVAATAVPIFQRIREKELTDAGQEDLADTEARQKLINTLLIATDMLNSEGTQFLREAAKRASNPTVYGAGKKGVANQLISDMRSNLVSKWIDLDYKKSKATEKQAAAIQLEMNKLEGLLLLEEATWEQAAYAAGEALLEAYKIQKPNVTRVTELMVKLTTFGFALKVAQWAGMHEVALSESPLNADIPKTVIKNGKTVRPNRWPLSRKQYQEILKNTFSMRFSTAANPEAVNLDDAENDESAFRVEGLGTSLQATLDLPQPANPRVSVLALTTIGAGDASMGTLFMQQPHQITNVWDGIEMIPTEVDELSVELNQAAWDAVQYDVLADFEKLATLLRQRLSTLTPDMQERVLEAYNSLVPEKQQLISFFGDANVSIGGEQAPSLFNEVADLERKLINEHKAQQEGLAQLKTRNIHFIQMANGRGYSPPVQTRDAVASPDMRAGWNDTVDSTFQLLGDKADRKSVIAMLDGVKWNRIQAYVWNRLKPLLPAGLTVTFARNAEQWEAATGKNDYGRTNGRTFIDGERVVVATAAPSIILHELMHATLTKLISNYTLNPASVPVGVRTAVNNLVQLLPTFRAMTDPRLSVVQGQIWKLQDVWGDTAAAVDEMMTYVLTDPVVMKAVSPSFIKKLYNRIREVFWSFLGKEITTNFLDEVIDSFTAITNDLITEDMGSYVAGTVRDATNPLDALSLRAFRGLAQIVARRPGMKVGNIQNDSLIDTIRGQYTLSADQVDLYKRVFTLLRLNARKGELEQFVSTALPKHPQANLFNGAVDLTASVLALAAVEPTFAAQLEQLYRIERGETPLVEGLIDKALNDNQHLRVEEMLTEAISAIVQDSEYELSKIGLITQRLDRLGSKGLALVGEKANEWAADAPRGASDLLKGVYALTTENGAEAFGRGLMDAVNAYTNIQALQSLVGALVGSQVDTNAVYRQVKRFKSVVARTRSEFTIVLPKVLKNLFPEDFDGWNDLYEHFGRLGVEVLGTDTALMFKNDDVRRRMITALESKLPNKWDAQNLAHYMVHGELPANTPHALLRNARAIADNLNGTPVTASEELVTDVDQLITLYAIEALTEGQRKKMARNFDAYPEQMEKLIGLLQKVRTEEARQLKDQYRYTYWKGELPLTTDPRHSIVIAGKIQGAKLEQLGYERGDKYKQSAGDPQSDLYYYTRPYAPPPVFAQGIIATVQQTAMGINYTTAATITPEVGTMITNRRLVDYINKNQGKASKLIPIHNFKGQVVGYERMLDRKKVREYTGSSHTLLHISIGQKLGRILEERWANTFNQQAIQILVNQWEDGKRRGTENQYESVNSTTNKQIARAWEVVPGHIKKQLEDAFGGPVMIRRDLIENTLGYHNAGVGDVFTGDASLSDTTRKVMMGIAQTIFMGPRAAQILYASEAAIKEGVATARDWIIVRSISVAYNNFMASINLVVANGVPIKDVIKYYRQGMQDVRVYNRLQNENIELMVKIAAAQGTERARLLTLQKGKLAAMKRLSIHPLVESGELSDLPEGLIESPDNTYLGDLSGWLNKKMTMIHPKMPMIAANIAIAKDSQFHDTLSKAVQVGDFLARYAVFQHMVNTGQGIETARDTVRDEFIAYAINPGRTRGYMENMGMVHWTQFTIRAQKVLLNRLRKNPFSFFVSQLGSTVMGSDGPLEMAITERGLDNSTGLDNVFNASTAHIYSKLL